MEDCIVYLVFQLRTAGFEVKFTWPNLLWISWKHHEVDYLSKQNPIIQAMMPEPAAKPQPAPPNPKAQPKKKQLPQMQLGEASPRVTWDDDIALLTGAPAAGSMTPAGTALNAPGVRRAADYQPPDSFMNSMDRPQKQASSASAVKGNVLADLWSI